MPLSGSSAAAHCLQPFTRTFSGNTSDVRAPRRSLERQRCSRQLSRDWPAVPQALLSTAEREATDQSSSPAIERLLSDILSEKKRLLDSTFEASPGFEKENEERSSLERRWSSEAASTSDSFPSGYQSDAGPSTQHAQGLRRQAANTARRRSQRYASSSVRGRTARRRPQGMVIRFDDSLKGTIEAGESESLQRLMHLEDQLRSRTPDVNDFADLYGIDLRPAAVLPRKVEIELTVIIRKSILADGTALQLQQKLGRIPSQQELADKLGLRSEQHLQLIRLNKQAAQQLMMRHNARLVVHVANKYVQWGVDLVDLVMEGMVGLERAIEKFEPEKGYKFSTYAFWWIRQKVSRCAAHASRAVSVPIAVYDMAAKIKKARHELETRSGEAVSDEQLSEAVGLSVTRINRALQATRYEQSFDVPANTSEEGMSFLDELEGPREGGDSEETLELSHALRGQLDSLLNTLPPRDRNIIRMHYGLHDPYGRGMHLRDISRAYGVSNERVRKIEIDAVARLSKDAALRGVRLPFGRSSSPTRRGKQGRPLSRAHSR